MILYKNQYGRVLSVNAPIPNSIPVDISDDPELCEYYAKCTNFVRYSADGTVDYSVIPPPEEEEDPKVEALKMELTEVASALNTLLGVNE